MGSDGIDGNSPVAGAMVDGTSLHRALKAGLDPYGCLRDNNSYGFFRALGDAIVTGYAGTVVNDFAVVFVGGRD